MTLRTVVLLNNPDLTAYQGDVPSHTTAFVDCNVTLRHILAMKLSSIVLEESL